MFHYGRTNEILQTSCSKLCSVQSLMNKPPPKTPTEDTTYLERMTLVRTGDWLKDALRVIGKFEWTFNMQRNAKPTRTHAF